MLPEAPIRILIIDDDRADREIYKRCLALSASGKFDFAEADSAAAGFQMSQSWPADCILLDYNLPDQDGLEMLRWLRGSTGRAPCAIVMLTAFGGEELAVKAMKAGVTDYLPKGRVAADTLSHTIVNAIDKFRLHLQIEMQQAELQKNARRYQVLLEAIPEMVWMAAADGRVEYANRRWFEYTGLRLEDATRLGWDHLLHPDDRERTCRAWEDASTAGTVFEIEHRLRRAADETYRWHLVRAAPLANPESGEILSWFGTCIDIEEQKKSEDQALQRQKLESIGRLAGGIAHDFNNLLVAILGGASLAMDTLPANHSAQGLLREILHAGDRAAQLTRQMLAYAGKSNFFLEVIDIGQLVTDTCDLLRRSLPPHVRLEIQSRGNVPMVQTDQEQMRQVITDLVMNAFEAVGTNGGTVTVRTEPVEISAECQDYTRFQPPVVPGQYVALEVSDTGCGMDEEIRKKIFDPFFTTKSTGRGLGLAAVQGFVHSNRGAILIESAPGRGTKFRLLLPAHSIRSAEPAAAVGD